MASNRMVWESQNRKRRLYAIADRQTGEVTFYSYNNQEAAYYRGYDDAQDGQRFSHELLGGTNLEAEEYRAGYLQGCAELVRKARD